MKDLERIRKFEDWIKGNTSKKLTNSQVIKETKWLISQAYGLQYILSIFNLKLKTGK